MSESDDFYLIVKVKGSTLFHYTFTMQFFNPSWADVSMNNPTKKV